MFMMKVTVLGISLFLGACASAPIEMDTSSTPKTPIKGAIAEFSITSFDGRTLEGRLLLGATAEAFKLDGRLAEDVDIELRKVRECGTNKSLEYYQFDMVMQAPQPDEIVMVRPGYWYGINASFLLFGDKIKAPKPDCFEAELWVWSLERRSVLKHPIRAERTDKPRTAPAGSEGVP